MAQLSVELGIAPREIMATPAPVLDAMLTYLKDRDREHRRAERVARARRR